jgi:hypothetical protein
MTLTPEALYLRLGSLVAEMPDLTGPITPEINRWLGRAIALAEMILDIPDTAILRAAANGLGSSTQRSHAQTVSLIIHRALAQAELQAPATSQGAFIAAGDTFDALAAVAKALATATTDVLLVDPYADATVLFDYAVLAPEAVAVRLLAKTDRRTQLQPAAVRWVEQFGNVRPLEVRLAPAKSLHDRLILADGATVYVLGQSFNKLAARAHTSLVRAPPDVATAKLEAYAAMWEAAEPL